MSTQLLVHLPDDLSIDEKRPIIVKHVDANSNYHDVAIGTEQWSVDVKASKTPDGRDCIWADFCTGRKYDGQTQVTFFGTLDQLHQMGQRLMELTEIAQEKIEQNSKTQCRCDHSKKLHDAGINGRCVSRGCGCIKFYSKHDSMLDEQNARDALAIENRAMAESET